MLLIFSLVINFLQYIAIICGITFLFMKFNKWYRRERVPGFGKKIVFITGTDHGFGKLLVTKLDSMGLKVYAGCFTKDGAEQLHKTSSERVKTVMIDVTKRETIVAARDFIKKDLGPHEELWGLVNNAGIASGILFDFCQLEDYRKTMEVNFFGMITTTEVFLPLIKKSRGRIVNLSSAAGRRTLGSESYSATKYAVEAYSDGLRRSTLTFGIRTSIIEPGFFRTPLSTTGFWASEMERTWNKLPVDLKEEYGQEYKDIVTKYLLESNNNAKISQWNKPEYVLSTIVHALLSKRPKSRYIAGYDAKILMPILTFAPDWFCDTGLWKEFQYDKVAAWKNQN